MRPLRQRDPRIKDEKFLNFVREQPCMVCGRPPKSQAAHIRMGNIALDKRPTGLGERPSDKWSVPLCAGCHMDGSLSVHRTGEEQFWAFVGMNPFTFAKYLYREYLSQHEKPFRPKKS
jgi:hypothetical protein